jgi:hypothetical protein
MGADTKRPVLVGGIASLHARRRTPAFDAGDKAEWLARPLKFWSKTYRMTCGNA